MHIFANPVTYIYITKYITSIHVVVTIHCGDESKMTNYLAENNAKQKSNLAV